MNPNRIDPATLAVAYVLTLVFFLGIDSIWLTLTSEALYRPVLGDMLAPSFRAVPAVLFYLMYVGGLTFFAVRPALRDGAAASLLNGAVFGFVAYGTYDLTNQATLKNWATTLTVADMLWGTALSAVAATLAAFLTRVLRRRALAHG